MIEGTNRDGIEPVKVSFKCDLSFQRCIRDGLLKDTDKYLLSDYPITPENLTLIKNYRQTLRDYMSTINENTEDIPEFPKIPF